MIPPLFVAVQQFAAAGCSYGSYTIQTIIHGANGRPVILSMVL